MGSENREVRRKFWWGTEQSVGYWVSQNWRGIRSEINGVVPVGGRTELDVLCVPWDESEFFDDVGIVRGEHPHVVTIKNIDDTLLAAGDEFMGIGAVLIGERDGSSGAQIKIVSIEIGHVPGSEIIRNFVLVVLTNEIGVQLYDAVAVGLTALWDVVPIGNGFGGLEEDVAGFIGGEADSRLPDGNQSYVRRSVEDGDLR
jgi:hypothetical protein